MRQDLDMKTIGRIVEDDISLLVTYASPKSFMLLKV